MSIGKWVKLAADIRFANILKSLHTQGIRKTAKQLAEVDVILQSGLFENLSHCDQKPAVQVWRYIHSGWKNGEKPHPLFDVHFYLEANPDVRQSGAEPFSHYLKTGWKEGTPMPSSVRVGTGNNIRTLPQQVVNPWDIMRVMVKRRGASHTLVLTDSAI